MTSANNNNNNTNTNTNTNNTNDYVQPMLAHLSKTKTPPVFCVFFVIAISLYLCTMITHFWYQPIRQMQVVSRTNKTSSNTNIPITTTNNNSNYTTFSNLSNPSTNNSNNSNNSNNRNPVSNPFCAYLLPRKQYYMAFQHKTGHIIGQTLFGELTAYCKNDVKVQVRTLDNNLETVHQLLTRNITKSNASNASNYPMIYHFTRAPINTILSGYNFWRNGREQWVNDHHLERLNWDHRFLAFDYKLNVSILSSATTTTKPYRCYMDDYILASNFPFPFPFPSRLLSDQPDQPDQPAALPFSVNDSQYDIHWMMARHMSIAEWYQFLESQESNHSIAIGTAVYQEFKRYFNCEYNDGYAGYQLIAKYHGENSRYHMFWNEDWRERADFNRSLGYFLDSINFVESQENLMRLKDGGIEIAQFNISAEREQFAALLAPLRLDRRHSAGHFADRKKQLNDLLSIHKYVCLTIKRMTEMISAVWEYSSYC